MTKLKPCVYAALVLLAMGIPSVAHAQRPFPSEIVGGATAAGRPAAVLVDADGTVHTTGTSAAGWPVICQAASTGVTCYVIPVYGDTGQPFKTTDTAPVGFFPDGADVAEGTTTDAQAAIGGTGSQSAKTRRISTQLDNPIQAASIPFVVNPCQTVTGTTTPISIASSGATVLIPAANNKNTFVCGFKLSTPDANGETVSVVSGTGTAMATSMVAWDGSTTAANGNFLAASGGGWVYGDGGFPIYSTTVKGSDFGLLINGNHRVTGSIRWVQQGVSDIYDWRTWLLISMLGLYSIMKRKKVA